MNHDELQAEWEYRYQERLGIMCGDGEPTAEQIAIARREASETIWKLREQSKNTVQSSTR